MILVFCTRTGKLNKMNKEEFSNATGSLSEFIKGKRKDLGLTQETLADKAGVGLRFIRELNVTNLHCK